MVSEGFDQFDLLGGERSDSGARQDQDADSGAFAEQRNAKNGSISARFLGFNKAIFRIVQNIRDVNGFTFEHRASSEGTSPRRNWVPL